MSKLSVAIAAARAEHVAELWSEGCYSIQQTAEALGLSRQTVYRLVYDGTIPSRQRGRGCKIVIPKRAVREFNLVHTRGAS